MIKNKRCIIGVLTSLVLVITANIAGAASITDFKDIPTDWSNKAVLFATENGLVDGNDGYIYPQNALTRAEVASMVSRLLKGKTEASLAGYNDIERDAWYTAEIARAVSMGIIGGDKGQMRPNDLVTREEAFVIIARILYPDMEKEYSLEQFKDKEEVSFWAKKDTGFLVSKKLIGGNNGNINPKSNITKAELSQILMNVAGTIYKNNGVYSQSVEGNVLISSNDIVMKDMIINGDIIIADGVDTGRISFENVTVKGIVIVRGTKSTLTIDKNSKMDLVVLHGTGNTIAGEGAVDKISVFGGGTGTGGSGGSTGGGGTGTGGSGGSTGGGGTGTGGSGGSTGGGSTGTGGSGGSTGGGGTGTGGSGGSTGGGGTGTGGSGGSTGNEGGLETSPYKMEVKDSFFGSPTMTAILYNNGQVVIGYTLYANGEPIAIDADNNGSVLAPKAMFKGIKSFEAVLTSGEKVQVSVQ